MVMPQERNATATDATATKQERNAAAVSLRIYNVHNRNAAATDATGTAQKTLKNALNACKSMRNANILFRNGTTERAELAVNQYISAKIKSK